MNQLFDDPRLLVQSVRVYCVTKTRIAWGTFPGSVIHGVLGFRLREITCVKEKKDCKDCFLVDQCPYGIYLETKPSRDSKLTRKYTRIPSPMLLYVEPWRKAILRPGDSFTVTITMVGEPVKHFIPVLMALEVAMKKGVGRKDRDGKRGMAEIVELEDPLSGEFVKWSPSWLESGLPFESSRWDISLKQPGTFPDLRFITPARIMANGRIQSRPSFRSIISSLTRRLSNLAYFHCGVELQTDFKHLVDSADELQPQSEFKRIKAERYSARQKTALNVDGITGSLNLEGLTDEYRAWLVVGEPFGLGKGTSMGFGQYKVTPENSC